MAGKTRPITRCTVHSPSDGTNGTVSMLGSAFHRPVYSLCLLLGLVTVSPSTLAWNDTGHMLVAAIAHNELNANERAALDTILQSHTNHSTWTTGFNALSPGVSLDRWIVMQAALWPDDIRDHSKPQTRPNQHFVDFPLRPPSFSTNVSQPAQTDNVIFAIADCGSIAGDIHGNKRVVAESLSFVIHFVGDVHQPLHCSSLFNKAFPKPEGDRGGTRFFVKTETNAQFGGPLHTLWDNLLGKETNAQKIVQQASTLTAAFPRSHFGAAMINKPVLQWSKESRDFSREKGYKPLPAFNGTNGNPILLPPGYKQAAQDLAKERITLAGYRLADELRAILTARGDVP